MPYSAERNEKYQREVLDRVEQYFKVNKESSTGMIFISGMSVSTLVGGIRSLFLAKKLVRRQVCLAPNSSKVVWAYRLADQPEFLVSFERAASRYVAPDRKERDREKRIRYREERKQAMEVPTLQSELPHYKVLRMLPVPRFEGYQEELAA